MSSKEDRIDVFSRHAEPYRKRLEESMRKGEAAGRDAILDYIKPHPGMLILDLACGPGTLTLPIADELSGEGEVIGVDLAQGMLDAARAAVGNRPLPVRFLRMDLEALQFPISHFDAACCGHGLQFLPNLGRALSGIKRVIKPRGRFAASVPAFAHPDSGPAGEAMTNALDARLGKPPAQPDLEHTRAIVSDPDRFAHAALTAGFRFAEVEPVEVATSWDSADRFVELNSAWWSTAARLEGLSANVRRMVLIEVLAAVKAAVGEGPFRGAARALVLRAEA